METHNQNLTSPPSLRPGLVCLLLFFVLEASVHYGALRNPWETEWLIWEGPVALGLLVLAGALTWRGLGASRPGWRAVMLVAVCSAAVLLWFPVLETPESRYRIEIYRNRRTLELFEGQTLVAAYPVARGPGRFDKTVTGDATTPLGRFRVVDKAPSPFHLWLGLNYPTLEDAWRGRLTGKISWLEYVYLRLENLNGRIPTGSTALGGDIGIHGGGAGRDWTECSLNLKEWG